MHDHSAWTSHQRSMRWWLVLAAASIGCTGPADEDTDRDAANAPPAVLDYRAAVDVPRVRWDSLTVDDVDADDHVLLHDTVVVLDRQARRLELLVRRGETGPTGSWHRVRPVGRGGDGPGHFRRPRAIAATPGGEIDVLEEDGRLQRLTRTGEVRSDRRLRLPCVSFRTSIAITADDQLVLGALCPTGQGARDTVYAMAWIELPDRTLHEIAREAMATADLRWGAVPVTTRYVTASSPDVVFAAGTDGCAVTVTGGQGPIVAATVDTRVRRQCWSLPTRYRATRPAAWRDLKMPNGAVMRWPDPLQPFIASIWLAAPALLQPISEDSLVVHRLAEAGSTAPAAPVLVGPTSSLVGCSEEHCLWFDAVGSRMALVDVRALAIGDTLRIVRR